MLCHAPASGKASCCLLCSVGLWSWWLCPEKQSIPSPAYYLLPEALWAVLLAFVTSKSRIVGSPTLFKQSCPCSRRRDPILLVSPSLLWDWKVNSNRFGERTIPWCHLRPTPICFGWTHLGSCQSVLEAQCCRSSRQALVCPL